MSDAVQRALARADALRVRATRMNDEAARLEKEAQALLRAADLIEAEARAEAQP